MQEITQDDIDKFIREREEQQMECEHLDQKVKEYKKHIKSRDFSLDIQWQMDIAKLNLDSLKTSLSDDIKNNLVQNYEIVILNLDKVVSRHCTNPDKVFPKDNLWVKRQAHRTARLIEFIENKNKIIPPIIQLINNKNLTIIDGNYRIALCRFLKLNNIPFIVMKKHIQLTVNLK